MNIVKIIAACIFGFGVIYAIGVLKMIQAMFYIVQEERIATRNDDK